MSTFKIEKTKGYTVMSNYHLRDKNLSLKAKGLLSQMLSLPDKWDYTISGLAAINKEGVDAIKSAVKELEQVGYITRQRIRNSAGQVQGNEYTVYEKPVKPKVENPLQADVKPKVENPLQENPLQENPLEENPTEENPTEENPRQINKDLINYLSNKDRYNNLSIYLSNEDTIDRIEEYRQMIKKNIDYDMLIIPDYKIDVKQLNGIVELMTDIVANNTKPISIGGNKLPAELVKSRLLKLTSSEIIYVLDSLAKNTTKIRNIRAYLLTALYNSPTTIDAHYMTIVHHDMASDANEGR